MKEEESLILEISEFSKFSEDERDLLQAIGDVMKRLLRKLAPTK